MTSTQAMTPDVTVIIPAYNAMPYCTATLELVFAQTMPQERIEIITVENGSTDGTGDELERLAVGRPNMKVYHQPNSGSPASPRNRALGLATGRYIFFLDADDRLNTESLERMVRVADEQGSDIVLGRQVGAGGRRPPRSMFTHTQLSTDVFHSRAWWFMNPMKLFRRAFIEELGLRFPEDHRFAEDQPFSGQAYLAARVISILADYDYLYFVWRDDGGNITLSNISVEARLENLQVMFDLVSSSVEAGPNRNLLLTFQFEIEVFDTVRAMALCGDAVVAREAFDRLVGWMHELYSFEAVSNLSPAHRIAYALLVNRDYDRLMLFMEHVLSDPAWSIHHEGDRVFADYPYFRDASAAVPDECYDVTARIRAQHRLDVAEWRGGELHLEGVAYLDIVPTDLVETELLVCERDGDAVFSVPVTRMGDTGLVSEAWRKPFTYENTRFSADISPAMLAAGSPLPPGLWDVRLRMRTGETTRDARIGCRKADTVDETVRLRLLNAGADAGTGAGTIVASYFTDDYGNLSLDVGPTKYRNRPWFAITDISWDAEKRATLHLSGRLDLIGLKAEGLRLVLDGQGLGRHELPVVVTPDGFTVAVPLRTVSGGRLLPRGAWAISIESEVGAQRCKVEPKAAQLLGAAYAWRGLMPDRITLVRRDGHAFISVARLAPIAALRRRLARALKR